MGDRRSLLLALVVVVVVLLAGCDPAPEPNPSPDNPPPGPLVIPGPTATPTPGPIDLRPLPTTTVEPFARPIDGRTYANNQLPTDTAYMAVLIIRDRSQSVADLCAQDDNRARDVADFLYEFMATQFEPPPPPDEGDGYDDDKLAAEPPMRWEVTAWVGQGVFPFDSTMDSHDNLLSDFVLEPLEGARQPDAWRDRAEAVWAADTRNGEGFLKAVNQGIDALRAAATEMAPGDGSGNLTLHLIVFGDGLLKYGSPGYTPGGYDDATEWDNVEASLVSALRGADDQPDVHLSYVLANCKWEEGDSNLVKPARVTENLNQWKKSLKHEVVVDNDVAPDGQLIKIYGHEEISDDEPYEPETAARQLLNDLFAAYLPPADYAMWDRQRVFFDQGDDPDQQIIPIPGYANAGLLHTLSLDDDLSFEPRAAVNEGIARSENHYEYELELDYEESCGGTSITLAAPPTTPTLIWWELNFPYLTNIEGYVEGDLDAQPAAIRLESQMVVRGALERPSMSDGTSAGRDLLHCYEYAVVAGNQPPADKDPAWQPFDPEDESYPFAAPFTAADLTTYNFDLPLTLFVRRAINYPGASQVAYNVAAHPLSVRVNAAYRPTLDPTQSGCELDDGEMSCMVHVLYATPEFYPGATAPETDYLFLSHKDDKCDWRTGGKNDKPTFSDGSHPTWYAYNTEDDADYAKNREVNGIGPGALLSDEVEVAPPANADQATTITVGVLQDNLNKCAFDYFAIRYKPYDGARDTFIACPLIDKATCVEVNLTEGSSAAGTEPAPQATTAMR